MDFLWLSLFWFACAWINLLHFYEAPSALTILAFGFGFLSAVSAFLPKHGKKEKALIIRSSLSFCLPLLILQAAFLPFYRLWAARFHAESFFISLLSPILNWFGLKNAVENSILYLEAPLKSIKFLSTWEKVGWPYLLLFGLGSLWIFYLKRAKIQTMIGSLILIPVYALLRYAFLIMIYASYPIHSIFWQRTFTFLTFLPLAFLLSLLTRKLPILQINWRFSGLFVSENLIPAILLVGLTFSGTAFLGLRDPGIGKAGRLLIDEYHSDWEWTTEAYDENWFGERSGYNYYCFFNYLARYFTTSRNLQAIDAAVLQDQDILILKTPTKPFTSDEIKAIVDFVEQGGGLYLIGDHTNVFGTGTNLNQLSKHFGITFKYDCTYELVNGNLSEFQRPWLLSHPSIKDLPPFLFASSNTLQAPWQAEEAMIGYGLKTLPADYSQKNFFPADSNNAELSFGLFLQAVAVQHGHGRVLAFTDSTVFSNFWMFMPGKPELLLGSVNWLNYRNRFPAFPPRKIAGLLCLLFLVLLLSWRFGHKKPIPPGLIFSTGLLSFLVFAVSFQLINQAVYPLPQPIAPITSVAFEKEYSRFQLPSDLQGFTSDADQQLNTFYVWTQRLDYFPKVEPDLKTALSTSHLTVMAKPGQTIRHPGKIIEQINAGANLLILDNLNAGGYANSLLSLAGMKLEKAAMAAAADYEEITNIPLTANASAIRGGQPLILDKNGNCLCASIQIGQGKLTVFSDPDLFYNHFLGDVSANLTEQTEILSKLEFKLLKSLVQE